MRLCISASQLGLPAIPNKHAARHLTLPAIKIGQISAIFDDCSIRSSRTTYQSLGPLPHYMLAVKKWLSIEYILTTFLTTFVDEHSICDLGKYFSHRCCLLYIKQIIRFSTLQRSGYNSAKNVVMSFQPITKINLIKSRTLHLTSMNPE